MSLNGAGYVASLIVAVVFFVAAVTKLRDLEAVAVEFDGLGLRRPKLAAQALPFIELGISTLLIVQPWLGAACALAMLCGFTIVLVRQFRSGVVASCSCFGATMDQQIGPPEFIRNVVLMALAAVGLTADLVMPTVAEVVVVVGASALGWAAVRVVRASALRSRTRSS